MEAIGTVLLAMLAGSLRVSTPFLFVSLGECLTEKSGRINLGNEGVLVLGAMVAYATSYETGSPWAGVAAAAVAGLLLGGLHGAICSLARVNDVAMGIAIMLAGTGIAFFFGKPYVQPSATLLPGIPLGFWSDNAQVRNALSVCPLFLLGIVAAIALDGPSTPPVSDCASVSSAIVKTRRWRSGCRSIARASLLPPAAARWRESAVHSCRCTIREVGTRACHPARD